MLDYLDPPACHHHHLPQSVPGEVEPADGEDRGGEGAAPGQDPVSLPILSLVAQQLLVIGSQQQALLSRQVHVSQTDAGDEVSPGPGRQRGRSLQPAAKDVPEYLNMSSVLYKKCIPYFYQSILKYS